MRRGTWRPIFTAVILAAVFVVAIPWYTHAEEPDGKPVSTTQLVERSRFYDGKEVVFRGEAVGDILNRGDNAWIAVNDDHYSKRPLRRFDELKGGNSGMGIYLPRPEADKINLLGSYTTRGDMVEVRGTFFKSSVKHGGDLCIVASSLDVLEKGHSLPESGMRHELFLAGALLAICLGSTSLIISQRKRRSRE
jgi:hypothetical protein